MPERLGEFVRALIADHPDLDVIDDLPAIEEAPPGSVLVLLPRPEHAGALNLGRPVFAHRKLKVILWCDHETTVALSQEAPDFYDWISEHHTCPPGAVPHAVAGFKAAYTAGAPGIVWRGPGDTADKAGLLRAFSEAFSAEALQWIDPRLGYDKLIEEIRAAKNRWIAFRAQAASHVHQIRWAMAEAKRRGKAIIITDAYPCPGWWQVSDALLSFAEARLALDTMTLSRPGALAALLGLEAGLPDLARKLLDGGMGHDDLRGIVIAAQDPGAALAARAYEAGLFKVDDLAAGTAPQAAFRGLSLVSPRAVRLLAEATSRLGDSIAAGEITVTLEKDMLLVEAALSRGVKAKAWLKLAQIAFATGDWDAARAWAHRAARRGGFGQHRELRRLAWKLGWPGTWLELELKRSQIKGTDVLAYVFLSVLLGGIVFLPRLLTATGSDRYLFIGALALIAVLPALAFAVYWRRTREDRPSALDRRREEARQSIARGAYEDAARACNDLLADTKFLSGEEHPRFRETLSLLADIWQEQAKYSETIRLLIDALATEGRIAGVEQPSFTRLLPALASSLTRTGRAGDGEALLRKLLGPAGEGHVRGEAHCLSSVKPFGIMHSSADEHLELFLALPDPPPLTGEDRARVLRLLAEALITQGRYEEAEDLLDKTTRAPPPALPPDHPERWRTLTTLGRVHALLGHPDRAEPILRRALALAEKHAPARHPDIARALAELARVEHRLGRPEAAATARRALDLYTTAQIAGAEKTLVQGELAPIAR